MGHSECARLKEHKIMRRYSTFRSLGKILVTEMRPPGVEKMIEKSIKK